MSKPGRPSTPVFVAQRAAYCALILAGVDVADALTIVSSSRSIMSRYVDHSWMLKVAWADRRGADIDRQREIVAHHLSGHRTLQQTGDAFGITRERVRQILVNHGVGARTKGRTDPVVIMAALNRYRSVIAAGESAARAAELAGFPYATLEGWAADRGEHLPSPVTRFESKWPHYVEFYQAHPEMTAAEVAFHFKTSPHEIGRALKAAGVANRWFKTPGAAARMRAPRGPKRRRTFQLSRPQDAA